MKAEPKGRYITPEHVEAYKNGDFKTLLEAIKEDPELSLEMRLNNEAKVYYHKDKILTTSINSQGEKKVTMLDKKYYDKYPDKERPSADIENIKKLRSITLIRKYFRDAKKLTYFYKKGTEFSFQQNIALGNRSFDNKYLVVDMEWQFSQEGIENNERISRTRIDLVIIDTEKNEHECNDIYLAELKVGTEATDGDSGIIAHVNKTYEIIQKKEACDSLKNDVKSIIDNKTELGLISGQPKDKDFKFGDKPKMMIISAYRGEEEKQKLEAEMQKAIKRAEEIGMEAPKCILYNALIQLKD